MIFDGDQHKGQRQKNDDLDAVAHVHMREPPRQRQTAQHTGRNAEHKRGRDADEVEGRQRTARCKAGKGREQHDDIHVIHRCTRQNHLRDALLCAVSLVHQAQHTRYNNCRRDCCDNRANNRSLEHAHAQQARCEDNRTNDLKGRRHETQQHSRTANLAQIANVQTQTGASQDNNKRNLAQVSRDGQQAIVEQSQRVRAEGNADEQHTQ